MPRYSIARRRGTHTGDAPPAFDFATVGLQWYASEETLSYHFSLTNPGAAPLPLWTMLLATSNGEHFWSVPTTVFAESELFLEGDFYEDLPWIALLWLGDDTLPTRLGPFSVTVS